MTTLDETPVPATAGNQAIESQAAFRAIPFMGVIHVVAEAVKLGFSNGHPDWSNLGQGQPEVGEMEGAPPRWNDFSVEPSDHAYGPVEGGEELRVAIADHYNRLFRQGKASQYGPENVTVAAGGRLILTRLFAALDAVQLGYQVPDYTAYEDMIGYHHHRFTPVQLPAREEHGFQIPMADLKREIIERGLGAFLISNPCNPTGQVIAGEDLAQLVSIARTEDCTLLMDEFYSQFIYDGDAPGAGPVSAAAHVEDVESDPVILVDGLTKGFRYPGWRVGWAVGPREMIGAATRAASAIDGGPPQPIQRAAVGVLEPGRADQETTALRQVFSTKRNLMIEALTAMGIRCYPRSAGTFYQWADLSGLPAPLNDAETFFRMALQRRVLTVPGVHFDVNPGKRRRRPSPLSSWMRFSFGPPEPNMVQGLERLAAMVSEAR